MQIIEGEKQKEAYTMFMEAVACVVLRESMVNIEDLSQHYTRKEIIDDSKIISRAVGQVTLDAVIEMTDVMSKEDIIKYLAESATQAMMQVMNNNPGYRKRILGLITK